MISKDNLPVVINGYRFVKHMASGGFSEVFLVCSEKFSKPFCAKVITVELNGVDQKWKAFQQEYSTLSHITNPHIIRLYDQFRIGTQLIMIFEYCSGGTLQDYIIKNKYVTKQKVILIAYQILTAIQECHSHGISHRDLKPSNILMDSYGRFKLADFGMATNKTFIKYDKNFCGSFVFKAPEVLQMKSYNPYMADMWSFGVILYFIFYRGIPWPGKTRDEIIQSIINFNIIKRDQEDPDYADLISLTLVEDPERRATASTLLAHPCFAKSRDHLRAYTAQMIVSQATSPKPLEAYVTHATAHCVKRVSSAHTRIKKTGSVGTFQNLS